MATTSNNSQSQWMPFHCAREKLTIMKWTKIKHFAQTFATLAIYTIALITAGYVIHNHVAIASSRVNTLVSAQQLYSTTNDTIQFLWTIYSDEDNSIRVYNAPVPPPDIYTLSRNDAIVTCAHSVVFSWETYPLFAVNEHLTYGIFERIPVSDPPTARFSAQPIIPPEYRPTIDVSVPITVRLNNLGLQVAVAQIRANGEFHIGAADPSRASLDFVNTFAISVEPFVIQWLTQ